MATESILGFGFYMNPEKDEYAIELALAQSGKRHKVTFTDFNKFGLIAQLINDAAHYAFDPETGEIMVGGGRLPMFSCKPKALARA